MQLTKGSVVRSTAGHDKGNCGVVIGFDRGWPLVADGGERKLERPKRKNPKHLSVTRESIDMSQVTGNNMLRRTLRRLVGGAEQPVRE